jgi:conjugative transposon TraJ protein
LIVLAILGPLVFGIAVFDGFQHTLTVWIARYINIFLWLPVANIFGGIIGKIQENMLKIDIAQVKDYGDTFFSSTDAAYLIFMVIGIVGYFTVPSVANYIVHAGGNGAMLQKVTSIVSAAGNAASVAGGAAASRMGNGLNNLINTPGYISEGYHSKDKDNGGGGYMQNRLSGKS